jgi:hypothetical protein
VDSVLALTGQEVVKSYGGALFIISSSRAIWAMCTWTRTVDEPVFRLADHFE